MAEIEFGPHDMTANDAPEPWVASCESEWSSSYTAYKAFVTGTTLWSSAAEHATSTWVKIDLGAGNSKILTSYDVQASNEPLTSPKAWTLQGSNNDSDWDTLDTVSDQTGWGNWETRHFVCDTTTTAYRYFRIYITESNGASYTTIGELYLYEEAPGPTQDQLMRHGCWFSDGVKMPFWWGK